MTTIDPKTEKTLTLACNELLKQLETFQSLDDWWNQKILTPTIKTFSQKFIALLAVEIAILYTHNWIAAFLCAAIMISLIYQTLVSISLNKVHAFLVLKIHSSFEDGVEAGELKANQISPTV